MSEHEEDTGGAVAEPQLSITEARVLGSLIEKEATTPEQFPLTANAALVACNQKTAREPVLELEPGEVGHALRTLEDKKLVRVIHGARALRYDHRTDDVYQISPEQRFLIGMLLLRGPQTAGELLARSERMHRYADADQVRTVLERLASRRPALVVRLPRGGGQREDRYAHLLCGPVAAAPAHAPSAERSAGSTSLADRVERLEAEVAELRAALDSLLSRPH